MSGVDLVCINLVESDTFEVEKFLKNLHLPHLLHPSKLSGKQSSFGSGSTFVKFFSAPYLHLLHPLPPSTAIRVS